MGTPAKPTAPGADDAHQQYARADRGSIHKLPPRTQFHDGSPITVRGPILLVVAGALLTGILVAQHLLLAPRVDGLQSDLFGLNAAPTRRLSGHQASVETAAACDAHGSYALDHLFLEMRRHLAERMGTPSECAHTNTANGDLLQRTSRGLALWRADNGVVVFTNGHRHWALVARDLVSWAGLGLDPPSQPAGAATSASAEVAHVINTDGVGVVVRASPTWTTARLEG